MMMESMTTSKLALLSIVICFVVLSVYQQSHLVSWSPQTHLGIQKPPPKPIPLPDPESPDYFPKLGQFRSDGERIRPVPGHANRTLVIILGNLRCGEDAWKTLYDHVLDVNSADLALMIGDTYETYQNATMFDRAKYLWKFQEYDDWGDAIDLIDGPAWRTELLPYIGEAGLLGGVKGKASTGGLLMMVRWFLIHRIHENDILEKYDRFVITRSDHYYLCDHNLSDLDPQLIWLPSDEGYSGFTDRHLVVGSEHLIDSIDLISPMIMNPKKYAKSKRTMEANIEQYQTRIWREKGILKKFRGFKRMMFVCAAPNDKTRWKEMTSQTVKEGVHIKYPGAHQKAVNFCNKPTKAKLIARSKIKPEKRIAR